MVRKKSKRCAMKGCRRLAREAGDTCGKCVQKKAVAQLEPSARPQGDIVPEAKPRQLTRVELLELGKLGAELEKSMLELRLHKYEMMEAQQAAEKKLREHLAELDRQRQQRAEDLQASRKRYDQLTLELSRKYRVEDPKKMIVDTETGLIHEAGSI